MALLNDQQSQLLTFPGFVGTFENRWLQEGLTQREAFGVVVREVKTITTTPLYDDSEFEEFIDVYKKRRKRLKLDK